MNNRDRQQSIDWAREVLKDPKLVILDTETTGLGSQDEVVQIGILSGTGGVLLDALIKPSRPIPFEATKVHGIGDKDVELAPDFRHFYCLIRELIQDRHVVIYNGAYDQGVLNRTCVIHNLPALVTTKPDCAMLQYAAFYGDWSDYHGSYKWQSLGNACLQLGLPVVNAHGAIWDCKMTLEVIRKMAEAKEGTWLDVGAEEEAWSDQEDDWT